MRARFGIVFTVVITAVLHGVTALSAHAVEWTLTVEKDGVTNIVTAAKCGLAIDVSFAEKDGVWSGRIVNREKGAVVLGFEVMSGSRDVVEGILKQLQVCIPEKVCQGYGVELQGIGIFYPTAKGVKGGCEGPTAFNNVKEWCDGIRIRFTPDQTKLDNLCQKEFKKHCSLAMKDCVKTFYTGSGASKKKDMTVHMPYEDWRMQGCPDLTRGSVEP